SRYVGLVCSAPGSWARGAPCALLAVCGILVMWDAATPWMDDRDDTAAGAAETGRTSGPDPRADPGGGHKNAGIRRDRRGPAGGRGERGQGIAAHGLRALWLSGQADPRSRRSMDGSQCLPANHGVEPGKLALRRTHVAVPAHIRTVGAIPSHG